MDIPRPNETTGPLAGHVRRGRVFSPPLAASGLLEVTNWAKTDLPDLIWPALVLSEAGTRAARKFVEWQKVMQSDLSFINPTDAIAEMLNGSLTGLARLAAYTPDAIELVQSRAAECGLLSEAVRGALSLHFRHNPAPWLAGDPVSHSLGNGYGLLSRALYEAVTDGHREAVIKCLPIWSEVQAGMFRADPTVIDLLRSYPLDPSTRATADSVVRSIWLARRAAKSKDDLSAQSGAAWAASFWDENVQLTGCVRHGDDSRVEEDQGGPNASGSRDTHEVPPAGQMDADARELRRRAIDIFEAFIDAVDCSGTAHSLQQQVNSGLVARAARDVITALGAPDLWCLEHGAHIGRMLVEVRIYIAWMAKQPASIYQDYVDYGAGKAKLHGEVVRELQKTSDRSEIEDAVEELKRLSHNGNVLDFRSVDTRDSFANGKSIRQMAHEAGLLDFYRRLFPIASGVSHSEWWSIETHAMEPCRNVLHGGHLIINRSLNAGGVVAFARAWVDTLYNLLTLALKVGGVV